MKQLPDLQELINIKAEGRLKNDLRILAKSIRDNRLISSNDGIPELIYKERESKPYWIFEYGSHYMDALKAYWLPIYQNEEAQNFIKQVENLNENVADLMNNINDY